MTLLLTKENVQSLLTMEDTIKCVELAYVSLVQKESLNPQRISLAGPGQTLIMPGMIWGTTQSIATKIVSVYRNNPVDHHLPSILAKIILQDIKTGDVNCVMDGTYITAMRTGAASGVSIKHLAKKQAHEISIYGAGGQSYKQVEAAIYASDRSIEKCNVYDPNPQALHDFKHTIERKFGIEVKIAENNTQMLQNADIILCATSTRNPLFKGEEVQPGTHISSIGSHLPTHRELDAVLLNRAQIIAAGSKSACLTEAGDFVIPISAHQLNPDKIVEMGDIISDKLIGRKNESDITVFKSVGIALQDVAVAKFVYDRALQNDIGVDFLFD